MTLLLSFPDKASGIKPYSELNLFMQEFGEQSLNVEL